jgi:ABC-type spermidine/putrescine transport system permease subunit II
MNTVPVAVVIVLIALLLVTCLAIGLQWPQKDDLLRLTEALLSWPVIASVLAVSAGSEIKKILHKWGK